MWTEDATAFLLSVGAQARKIKYYTIDIRQRALPCHVQAELAVQSPSSPSALLRATASIFEWAPSLPARFLK